jgi:glyoxylase-like metal-dependent hydrolase (beta-lactamase superfamily II)
LQLPRRDRFRAKTLIKAAATKRQKAGNSALKSPSLKSLSRWEDITMELTRRHALTGAAALAATPLLPSMPVRAAAPVADKQAPSFYRYKVGDIQVTVVSDGKNVFKLEDSFVTNAKKDEVNAALVKAFLPPDMITIYFAPLVINTGGKLVVLDTGNGPVANVNSKGANGLFAANMAAAGLDPKAVDMVVISHFHGDHVNGLLTADGTPAFPNAEVLVPATEWKFWMDDGEMSRAPAGRMQGLFKNNRNIFEAALKKKVTPYEWGKEVAPGMLAVETPGHTPGHTSYVLSSGSGKVFIQSDVTNSPSLFAANPGWQAFFDQDGDMAEKTRRRVYDMVVAEKLQVQGFHYPFPGLGNVEKDGSGYRVVPALWNPTI